MQRYFEPRRLKYSFEVLLLKVHGPVARYANASFSPDVNFSRLGPFENMIRLVLLFVRKTGFVHVAVDTMLDIEHIALRASGN